MQQTREEYIQDIRARLPYMPEEDLSLVYSLIGVQGHYGYSTYEAERPVLTQDQQHQADIATLCMGCISDAISQGSFHFLQGQGCEANDVNALGVVDGDVVIVDAKAAYQLYREAGWRRVKKSDLFAWMENAEYILPRSVRPKTAMLNGERREVLYMPVKCIKPFLKEVQK